ncbi:MAG: hypothetical protein IJH99_00315 [Eubacterium sp.]|nr:hypothetical protein [Eubacterium sp.]
MTSKNLSSDNSSGRKRYSIPQKEITKRRMWVVGLTALMFILYLIAGIAIVLAESRSGFNAGLKYGVITGETLSDAQSMIAAAFYGSPVLFVITGVAAIASGIQGYSWLHNKKAVDFYESQPVSRTKHFFGVFLNSILIYLAVFIATMLISLLIAAAMGARNPEVLPAALQALLVNTGLFLACFSIAALAAVLTGNAVVSILAAGVLFLYEPVMRFTVYELGNRFFATFPESYRGVLSGEYFFPFSHAFHDFGRGAVWHNLVIAAAVMLLAWFCFTKRKNETAGSAVVFLPVKVIVKIALALLGSLFTGLVFSAFSGRAAGLIMAVIAAFVIACVMEIIYAYNFKALFRRFASTAIAVVLGAGILLVFMLDIFGYDSWMPKEGSVKYAAVSFRNSYNNYYHDDGRQYSTDEEYYQEYMHVTDMNTVMELVDACRKGMAGDSWNNTDVIHVIYTMNNGFVKVRKYDVPADIDRDIIARLISNPEFKEGWYPIYHNGFTKTFKGSLYFGYEDGWELTPAKSGRDTDLDAFRDAYLADMEKLDYAYMLEHRPLGQVAIGESSSPYIHQTYTIYEGFDNTLAFLQSEGITVPGAETWFEGTEEITVTYDAYGVPAYIYTGTEETEAIRASVMPDESFPVPFRNFLESTDGFHAEINGENGFREFSFIKGRVPSFILDDFKEFSAEQ